MHTYLLMYADLKPLGINPEHGFLALRNQRTGHSSLQVRTCHKLSLIPICYGSILQNSWQCLLHVKLLTCSRKNFSWCSRKTLINALQRHTGNTTPPTQQLNSHCSLDIVHDSAPRPSRQGRKWDDKNPRTCVIFC